MKRTVCIAVALSAIAIPRSGRSADPYEQKLDPDRQVSHALSRLTFGPRPGDEDQVRRIGLAKWMEQQLHPEQIAENPVVLERLKPLETLEMTTSEIVDATGTDQGMGMVVMIESPFSALNKLGQTVRSKILNGTAEERTEALDAMDPAVREKILGTLPDNVMEHTPKYKDQAEKARKAVQEERRAQQRSRFPQLRDLLKPDEIEAARSGDKDRVVAIVNNVDADKRMDVVAMLPPKSQAFFPQ